MPRTYTDADIRIIDFPETPIALIEHRGDELRLGETIRRFIGWRKETGLPPAHSRTFNLLHTDPDTTPPEEYRIDLACEAASVVPNAAGIRAATIPAGRCAVIRMTGSPGKLRPAASFLYADWLPRSGEELRDYPMFAERISFFPEVPENQAITDILLPLR